MKRITLRVPDHQHAALSRLLTLERGERGNRYSLNDLCTRLLMVQLSHGGASLPRAGEPAPLGDGTMHIPRMPPPPPVPIMQPSRTPIGMPFRFPQEEPQPERSARASTNTEVVELVDTRPMPAPSDEGVDRGREGELMANSPSLAGSSPALGTNIDDDETRMTGEGGPDGHLDH